MNWKLGAMLCASVCFATDFELGMSVGYGSYRNAGVTTPAGSAVAGFDNKIAAGAFLGEDLYQHLSGELRYTYQDGGPFVKAGSSRSSVTGMSHAVHYDFLLHPTRRDSALRPYLLFGGGVKDYRVTGTTVTTPLPQYATFGGGNHATALATVGGGVRYRVSSHVYVRGEFLDYITPFPDGVFVPAAGGKRSGVFHQLTPLFGVSFRP